MDVLDWLLDGDPAIRWQVLRDLCDAPADEVAAERARVGHEGWGARLLAEQGEDGLWCGGAWAPAGWDWDRADGPGQPWTATLWVLELLDQLGLPGDTAWGRRTRELIDANGRWEYDDLPYWGGEVDACINGRTVRAGAWLGQDVRGIVDWLLEHRLEDGGWNCEAYEGNSTVSSFDTTIGVVEGLLAWERAVGGDDEVAAARTEAEEYLLQRQLFRRRSTGEVADEGFLQLAFPTYWRHDVLRGLEHLREADRRDPRAEEAAEHVRSRRTEDGRWLLDRRYPGEVHLHMEEVGEPSRWITLRALRALRWWDAT